MDKQEAMDKALAARHGVGGPEGMCEAVAKFSAILPFVAGAIRFHGDSGIRITLEIDDSGVEEVKKLIDWRHGALKVTVRPVPK